MSRLPSISTRPSTCAAEPAFAGSPCVATPTSPRPSTWTAEILPATSTSSSGSTTTKPSKPEPTSSRLRLMAFWSDRRGMKSRRCPASSPNGSSSRSSTSGDTRRSTYSRRRSPSSTTSRPPAGEVIGSSSSASGWESISAIAAVRGVSLFLLYHNDRDTPAEDIVFSANDRCNQENLIAELKSGVYALTTPVDTLVGNWAYMVMASLAWSLKAWIAC